MAMTSKRNDQPETRAKQRDVSFDAFRGLAIFFVVIAHTTAYGWLDGSRTGFNFWFSVANRTFELCALPMFLFISGYWLATARFDSKGDYVKFLGKRVSRVAIPYLFWSVFFILLYSWRAHSFSAPGFIKKLVLGQAEGPYFFIVMLLQFYVLTPLFVYLSKKTYGLKLVVGCHAAFTIFLYVLRLVYFKDLSFAIVKLPFLTWLSFFFLGVYYRGKPGMLGKIKTSMIAALVVLLFASSVLESAVLLRFDYFELAISDVKITTFLYAASVLFLLTRLRHLNWPRILVVMGDYAFGIFFIHGIILRQFASRLGAISVLHECQPVFQLAVSLLTVGVCCVVIFTARKVLPGRIAGRLFGF